MDLGEAEGVGEEGHYPLDQVEIVLEAYAIEVLGEPWQVECHQASHQ